MTNKERYAKFEKKVYIPIYSKSWWMDTVCGEDNWDVWLYGEGNNILAAMPYYMEKRGDYHYITKAPLTQNNGILFCYPDEIKLPEKAKFEEKIIDSACSYITSLKIDVYEQQYTYSFNNVLPFYWNSFQAITRYTYVIDTSFGIDAIWSNMTSKQRSIIKKGLRNCTISEGLSEDIFYQQHKKVFEKQGLSCPFSYELWQKLYGITQQKKCSKILFASDEQNEIFSLAFIIWDKRNAYLLLGGSIPEYSKLDTYSAVIWEGIRFAEKNELNFDFEGSVIKRISKSFREFGGIPKPYYRIRKVFNPNIISDEARQEISNLSGGI